jgi:hypothetical protein
LVVRQVQTDGEGRALPIGHSEVVFAVVRALASADVEPAETGTLAQKPWRACAPR